VVFAAAALLIAAVLGSVTFPHGSAQIRTAQRTVTVRVELASTPAQLRQGLKGRRSLPRDAGMAFLFAGDTRGTFWMKDTLIPLSVAFWDRRGRIVRILDMAPCRRDPCAVYDPKLAFRGALEVNRGAFRRWGIRPGARVSIRR
jgi:hypothetical protein